MKQDDKMGLVLASLVATAISLMLLLPPLLNNWSTWRADDKLAAWVQAIGSLVAIGLAIAVPAWQHQATLRRDEARERREAVRTLQIALLVAWNAAEFAQQTATMWRASEKTPSQFGKALRKRMAKERLSALDEIPIYSLPTSSSASCVLSLRMVMEAICQVLDEEWKERADYPKLFDAFHKKVIAIWTQLVEETRRIDPTVEVPTLRA